MVSLRMVKLEAFIEFSVANRTKIAGMCVGLVLIVKSFHQAFIPSTVAHAKHVAKLMCCYFDNSLKNHGLSHFLIFIIFFNTIHVRSKPSNALDSTIGWYPVPKAIVTQVLCEKINIRK